LIHIVFTNIIRITTKKGCTTALFLFNIDKIIYIMHTIFVLINNSIHMICPRNLGGGGCGC